MSSITYNGANRPVRFRNEETDTTVDCGYDSQGRRFEKKVTVAGTVTLHHRYIYRGYLQIACVDCTRSGHPALWLVTWDPSQPLATRPLAIQKDGTWFTYGYDLTKNICEVFGPAGYIRTAYSYAPFGAVSASGDVTQPFQWSSEHYDSELDLVYYNYRHYSPSLGRFLSRDPIAEQGGLNLYAFVGNNSLTRIDSIGREIVNNGSLTKRTDAYAVQKRGLVIYRKNAEIKLHFGGINHSTSTCCYYIGGIDVYLTVEGFYADEVSRRHEQLHMDTWLNAFYSFELVAKSILFKRSDLGEIQNYLRYLLRFYEIRGWRDNSEIDMYAHKGMDDGEYFRQNYIDASNNLAQQKKILDSMKGVLCSD